VRLSKVLLGFKVADILYEIFDNRSITPAEVLGFVIVIGSDVTVVNPFNYSIRSALNAILDCNCEHSQVELVR